VLGGLTAVLAVLGEAPLRGDAVRMVGGDGAVEDAGGASREVARARSIAALLAQR
jgi:hypothetical protein